MIPLIIWTAAVAVIVIVYLLGPKAMLVNGWSGSGGSCRSTDAR